jgi:hypothetical protein
MFWFTLLWVSLFLVWTGGCLRVGWMMRGDDDFNKFMASLTKPRNDPPPPMGTRV